MGEQEEIAEIAMQIIAHAGEARSRVYEALEACIKKDFKRGRKLIGEAEKYIVEANKVSHSILSKEARGENIPVTLLLIHALDILMASIIERDLAKRLIRILEAVNNSKK